MGLTFASDVAHVRTPATSANLGPGFDALGLALTLYDDVSARVTDRDYTVRITGEGAGDLPTDASHLVVRAMLATFDQLGERPPGLAVE
jgi:homoserine kinase